MKTADGLFPVVKRMATAFGFRHVTFLDFPDSGSEKIVPLVHMTTLPIPLLNVYDAAGLLPTSPIAATARKRPAAPLQWQLQELIDPSDEARAPVRKRMERMRMSMGIICSVPSPQGRLAVLFLGDRRPLTTEEERDLAVLAERAANRFEELSNESSRSHTLLSARELEVVRWSAEGKTSSEIGCIIGLSDHTVNAYLANAIRKLDCVNRTQLVAKAIRLKLID
ncbi:helix-turn-helix transcriptional regulator [Martelella endophytica]|uniref:HTH luxR-type domain-containing protein n=1 Tax=Martelella endophytica TaxID=1486262 RepID=A0A0D5LQR4_MAREN|nr:LuxR C-terminal-related transcriptional regulator [Martelella endophytica]AJY45683.1 hypothetical protein TM49_08310 [Martelella endophytica]